ncbi:sulfotransferase [Thiohalobacter sp.]|uniref:sulfotransferase n=1 Tax=Thiohalobacter sp. TaxID=2025948 RepID=UPI0026234482|nr:sulfotransferase [Thiohalobacter sp.]
MSEPESRLVVIAGSGRSGTTFLAKLFDSSPEVLYRHEPDSVLRRPEIPFHPDAGDVEAHADAMRDYLGALMAANQARCAATTPTFPKSFRSPAGNWLHRALVYGSKLPPWGKDPALRVPDCLRMPPPVTVIKTVDSLCRLRLMARARPDARFLHIVRHPCAVAASVAEGHRLGLMKGGAFLDAVFAMPEAAGYPFDKADIAARSPAEQVAFKWMVQNDKTHAEMAGGDSYRLVSYERLCVTLRAELTALFAHAGVAGNPQTDRFLDRLEQTRSAGRRYFSVVRNPRSGLFKWRQRLPAGTVAAIEAMVQHSAVGRLCLAAAAEAERAVDASAGCS